MQINPQWKDLLIVPITKQPFPTNDNFTEIQNIIWYVVYQSSLLINIICISFNQAETHSCDNYEKFSELPAI